MITNAQSKEIQAVFAHKIRIGCFERPIKRFDVLVSGAVVFFYEGGMYPMTLTRSEVSKVMFLHHKAMYRNAHLALIHTIDKASHLEADRRRDAMDWHNNEMHRYRKQVEGTF